MNILVIGESCNDVFVYGDIERISPEAPVPVFVPTHTESNDGMAKNVVNNVESLVLGDSSHSHFLLNPTSNVIHTVTNRNSIVKRRFVESRSGQMVLRVDENDYCDRIDTSLLSGLIHNKFEQPPVGFEYHNENGEIIGNRYDAIIISDYCKGFLEEEDIQHICKNNSNVFIDTKKKLGEWIKDADYIKLNEFEYNRNHELLSDIGFEKKLIITMGNRGCKWNGKEFPVDEVKIGDVSGAGDTFIAGLVHGYLDTLDIESAIKFAQKCTNIVVQEPGVTVVKLKL